MGIKYLWDTNAVIYYLQKNFASANQELMSNIINSYQPVISAISQIELLSWRSINEKDTAILSNFVLDCAIVELEHDIKFKTIELRKLYGIKLPDAVIAATAIVKNLTLISNDNKGFKKIPSLKLLNPTEAI